MTSRSVAVLSLLAAFLLSSAEVRAENTVVDIQGTQIVVPIPNGFRDLSSASGELWDFAVSTMTPPGNRLLAVFVTDADYERIRAGLDPELKRFMNLQILSTGQFDTITPYQFALIARDAKRQQTELLSQHQSMINDHLADISESIEREADVSTVMRITDLAPLGVFFERSDAFGFAYLMKEQSAIAGEQLDDVTITAGSFTYVRRKILFGYATATYESEADTAWAQQLVEVWATQIQAANPTVLSP